MHQSGSSSPVCIQIINKPFTLWWRDESIRALHKAQGIISDEEASPTSGGDNRLGEHLLVSDLPSLISGQIVENQTNKQEAKFCFNPRCGIIPIKFLVDGETIGEAEKIKQEFVGC